MLVFEIDLAKTASFGFFYGNPIGGSELLENRRGRPANQQYVENAKVIKRLLKDEYLREGAKEFQVERSAEQDAQRNEVADDRRQAYIGWLVTNLEYRSDVERLRGQWSEEIGKLRTFPAFPRWTNSLQVHERFSDESKNDFQQFYAHWGLDNLVTWDWPMPMLMDLEGGMIDQVSKLAGAGMWFFVPWYLLREKRIDFQEIVNARRPVRVPKHLREWVENRYSNHMPLGELRFERLGYLYRVLYLTLFARYPSLRTEGDLGKIDRAISLLWGGETENVRKLRLHLQKILPLDHLKL